MSPTPIRDPNAPPDPSELRLTPDHQMMGAETSVGASHNPVLPGAPPSPDYPTGVPPVDPDEPTEPPPTVSTEPPVNVDVPQAMGPDGDDTAIVGETVTVTMGNWENKPDTYEYLWKKMQAGQPAAIPGETTPSYVTTMQDANKEVFCTLLVSNEAGQTAIDSNLVSVTNAAADADGQKSKKKAK